MLILIDNTDSFTHNISHAFQILGCKIAVYPAHSTSIADCNSLNPTHIVIGPGPGSPEKATLSLQLIHTFAGKIPLLGICLGHQCLATAFGGVTKKASRPMHGKLSPIFHINKGIFRNLPQGFQATRYHSLLVENSTLPSSFEITAQTDKGEIMGIRHRQTGAEGVQFHPEAVLTENGLQLLHNFLT